jgi:dolichyl-phosphate-mannose-protein mannosyltransferase
MAAHMLDHFVFSARRFSERTKSIVFAVVAGAIVANFWWFRGVAWGIDGPINEHWGLGWRKVGCQRFFLFSGRGADDFPVRQSWNIYEL